MKKLSQLAKSYNVLFADMDGTLIETKSGKTFPEDWTDWQFKDDVLESIINLAPDYLLIVTNQGGIGKFVTVADFEKKLSNIVDGLRLRTGVRTVEAVYCASEDKNEPMRKPNIGMFTKFTKTLNLSDKKDMLMIGDASGKPGNFSDSDKKFAINAGIDYLDVNDFVKIFYSKKKS